MDSTQTGVSTTQKQRLFQLLKTLSFQEGEFVLASGQTSSYYMDARLTTLSAAGACLIGEILFERCQQLGVTAVGGMTMGADPIVSAITVISAQKGQPINGFLVRKEAKGHGTRRQIEGHLPPNSRVALVEDVITTGGSVLKALQALEESNLSPHIVEIMALVDRRMGQDTPLDTLSIPIHCLFPIQDFLTSNE